jgi:hypothetical protein
MTFTISLRRQTALVLGLMTLAGPALAQTQNNLVDLRVINRDTGEVLRTWSHDGRLYVAGEPGTRYGLRFYNHTGNRVLVVASVDGVNIITGETANFNERGYVLSPWQSYDVNGWRKSETAIADFQFAPLSGSYAALTGRPGDVGVIGIAVFRERTPPPEDRSATAVDRPTPNIARSEPSPPPPLPAPARAMAAPPPPPSAALSPSPVVPAPRSASGNLVRPSNALQDEKLGTAHGASEWSVITTVDFIRATNEPQAMSLIEYDTWDHLVANGVIPRDTRHHPQAFPGEPRLSYVPDPPAYHD